MNTPSLTYYETLNNLLKAAPRNQIYNLCREHGFHSWHCNAKQNPNYAKHAQNGAH